ncbi:Collagen type IV alpha-3-binding protein [Aphelenchoides besseyi]|nr:Collagen type IV alpha-3-binding protein [Aphelenchoides besseyi]
MPVIDAKDKKLGNAKDRLVVVKFFATWCGPCRMMAPKFSKLSNEFPEILCVEVDVDEQEDIVADYDIKVMPTFVFIKNGQQEFVLEGNNVEELQKNMETRNINSVRIGSHRRIPSDMNDSKLTIKTASRNLKVDALPCVVINEVFKFFSFDELGQVRRINHFFKRHAERRLNEAFFRLGRDLNEFSIQLKKRLPRKESARKEHPLNRYYDVISAIETRYTMLAMTFKKYLDSQLCCFIPGRVLDMCFQVLEMIRNYVNQNIYVQLNVVSVMRDIRDYSTMATEHFELHIVPLLSQRYQGNKRLLNASLLGYSSYYRSSICGQSIYNARRVSKILPSVLSSNFNQLVQEMNSNSATLQAMINPADSTDHLYPSKPLRNQSSSSRALPKSNSSESEGYQKRYFKLRKGTLSYYLSEELQKDGCRKFRALKNFTLELDDLDETRIDICFSDERWCLRFESVGELNLWRCALESFLYEDPDGQFRIHSTEQRRHSVRSLQSNQRVSNNHEQLRRNSNLTDQFNDKRQVLHTTTTIVEHAPQLVASSSSTTQNDLDMSKLVSLRSQLPKQFNHVMEVLNKVVNTNGAPLDLAVVEQACETCKQMANGLRYIQTILPTIQVVNAEDAIEFLINESMLSDDEWHDAESNDGALNDYTDIRETLKEGMKMPKSALKSDGSSQSTSHKEAPIFEEIRRITDEQLSHAMANVNEGEWELFVRDGDMRMYKMEKEIDGIMIDPLKALHSVKGVTAREFIDIFFDPNLKQEWDDTLTRCSLVDRLSDNTVVIHQIHKKVWPAAQRESLFWSTREQISRDKLDSNAHSGFIVCNHDCEREDVPLTDPSCVRVRLKIAMVCETIIETSNKPLDQLERSDVRCKIIYVAQVHPGGWLPSAALRQVYKREYPKFLRQFSAYVQKKVKGKPLNL